VTFEAAAAIGPYFVWEPWTPDADWRPLTDLTDPAVVAERVHAAKDTLVAMTGLTPDELPDRAIASITFLGLASRLVSPPLAAFALSGERRRPRPDQLWWRAVPGGPIPMAYSGLDGTTDLVEPVLRAFADRFAVSDQVMWGNVASALAGATGMLATTRPDLAAAAGDECSRVLAGTPQLAGAGTLVRPDPASPRRFLVRNNCCLYYRIPGGGYCGDCVLTPEPERERTWSAALEASARSALPRG
jgi:hypothetical protein